jgi:hypothetical protein
MLALRLLAGWLLWAPAAHAGLAYATVSREQAKHGWLK